MKIGCKVEDVATPISFDAVHQSFPDRFLTNFVPKDTNIAHTVYYI